MKTRRSTSLLASLTGAVLCAGLLVGANAASADSIKYESYQRSSQTEACADQPGQTPWQTSWGEDASWHPSWEQWANRGTGGWTCTRSITWARDSGTAEVRNVNPCTFIGFGAYVFLDPTGFIPFDTQTYQDASCAVAGALAGNAPYGYAFTSSGDLAAQAICRIGNSISFLDASRLFTSSQYQCRIPPDKWEARLNSRLD